MNELVGKYARFGNEIFEIVDELIDDIVHLIYNDKGFFLDILDKENNIVIKDDARELAKVGDLVQGTVKSTFDRPNTISEIYFDKYTNEWLCIYIKSNSFIFRKDIKKIWTKIDKDTYKCQWRKENE